MARLTPFLLPILVSLGLVGVFPWPLPYRIVTDDPFAGAVSFNYLNLAIDFFVYLIISLAIFWIVNFVLVAAVLRSLFKEAKETEDAPPPFCR